jgi:hypothetical protein
LEADGKLSRQLPFIIKMILKKMVPRKIHTP